MHFFNRRRIQILTVGLFFTATTAHAEQFNVDPSTPPDKYVINEFAAKTPYWDETNNVLQFLVAPPGTAGNNITWTEGLWMNMSGQSLFQVGNDTGGCTSEKLGRLRYNGTSTWEYCNGSAWTPFEQAASGGCVSPAPCDDLNEVCSDGTVFIGCHPTTGARLYATRCHLRTPVESSGCASGSLTLLAWNNGNSTGRTDISGANSYHLGAANSAALLAADSDNGVAGTQPHLAAQACDNLSVHGHSDWYLPAPSEVSLIVWALYSNYNSGNGLNFVSPSWSSQNVTANNARHVDSSVVHASGTKNTQRGVHCVRSE